MKTWLAEGEECLLGAYTLNALDRLVEAGTDYLFFMDVTPEDQRKSEYSREYCYKDGAWTGDPTRPHYGHQYIVRIEDPRMKMRGYVECFVTTDAQRYEAYKAQMKRYFDAALMARRPNGVLPANDHSKRDVVALLKRVITLLEEEA